MKNATIKNRKQHEKAWTIYTAGQIEEASKLYRAISRKFPHDDNAWLMLGIIEGQLGNYARSEEYLRHAIKLNNNNTDALVNHGLALFSMGCAEKAISEYIRVLKINPHHVNALLLLGNAYARLDQLIAAENSYKRLLDLNPSSAVAYGNLANVLAYQGRQVEALDNYRKAMRFNPGHSGIHSNLLLCMHYSDTLTLESIYAEHQKWASRHCSAVRRYTEYPVVAEPSRKLRVGYVTPDLRGHSVAYFIEPLLQYHDRGRFEIYCYVEVVLQDEMTKRLWSYVDVVRDTSRLDDAAVARMIHDDRVDILIDLAGHTENNRVRVFSYKPAPVQITYLGYPDTTGLDAVDYRVTDARADPPGLTEHLHSEKLLRLDAGFLCFAPPDESPPVSPLPALERGYITFGSFNVLTKITPAMLDAWAAVLHQVPSARLLIKNRQLTESGMRQHMLVEMAGRNISEERVTIFGTTSKEQHMSTYREVDIALDTYPYNGTTTTCDTLWMGIPVITMAGSTHVSRVGASLLSSVGLDELVCTDAGKYINKAVALAGDVGRLTEIRSGLRQRMQVSSLCDAKAFTRIFEEALLMVWREWCESCSGKGRGIEPL